MAVGIGKTGSFATTEAPQDYISGALQNVENQGFRYRAERRQAQEKKDAAKIEEEKQLAEHLKNFNIDLTGSQSIDDLSQSFAQDSFNQYAELARKLQQTRDPNERLKLRTEQARINQNITALKQIPSILKEKAEYISKNIDKLNPDDVDIMQQKLGMLEKGNAKVYLDENKIPRINIYKVDENGQVTDILEKEQTVADFITGINPHMKSNYNDLLKKAVENTAVSDITTQKGIYISREKKVDDKVAEEKAETFAEMIINNPNEAYAFSKAKGIDLNDKQALKEAVKKDYKNSLDVLRKEDIDSGLISATKPTKGEKEDKPIAFNDKPIFVTKTGVKPGTNLKLEEGNIGYSFGNATIKQEGGKAKTAKGIYVDPKTGKVKLWVEERGYTTVSEDKSELTASGKAKLEREKKKLGTKFNYKTFVNSGVLEPSDYSSQKTSTKDTQERLIDLNTQAGQAMEYADLLGVSVGDLKSMYLEKARRDKPQRPTSNKQKVDEYGVPIK
jgi:hypothetical protein